MINKILIANRGEIAIRVIRTCREMGIRTVAIYSDADRTAPHVLKATEAYRLGPAPSTESYLNVDRILEIIRESGADAVHPGYGFLSENAAFARSLRKAGIVWIGPPADVIETMGDKMAARQLAEKVSAPIVPGTTEPITDPETARAVATSIGYPVLVKAAGGGGGKGMRIVREPAALADAFERARSEAGKAFSDDRIYIEKYLEEPHHIEIQVFADDHGNVVHLGERECSIQRRYQKIIEETPSPFIDDNLRTQLCRSAVEITKACGYVGAGTVEFLVDKHFGYYFLEMNTRLQVEHPITEMVTGLDLVKEQIRVSEGAELSVSQNDIRNSGHAVECRIYAENGFNNFSPSIGDIQQLEFPLGYGVRMDEGIRAGQSITPYYDPLLGKLITWGNDRAQALQRMVRALKEFHIVGINTTIPFCLQMISHSTFQEGHYSTKTLDEIKDELLNHLRIQSHTHSLAAGIAAVHKTISTQRSHQKTDSSHTPVSQWVNIGRKDNLR